MKCGAAAEVHIRGLLCVATGLFLVALSGCGPENQPNPGSSGSAQVHLNIAVPHKVASAQNQTHSFWATLRQWFLPSEAYAAGAVTDLSVLRVDVSAPDLLSPTHTEINVSNPSSGAVITIPLTVPVGSSRVFTVSGLDATRARIFVGQSAPVTLGGGPPVTVDIDLQVVGTVGSLNLARASHTATLLSNGQVLVVGGTSDSIEFPDIVFASAELFNPVTQQWSALRTGLADARARHTATLLPNGQVLVVGGRGGDGVALGSVEVFNPVTQQWEHLEGVRAGTRFAHTSTLLPNGQVVVVGGTGFDSTLVEPMVLINPMTREWIPLSGFKEPREDHTATLLVNGQVLVAGGDSNPGEGVRAVASAELFDPTTQQWTTLPTGLTDARTGHTATRLLNGQVLVVGGMDLSGSVFQPVASAELFNPTTQQWTKLPTGLTDARWSHTATLLPNGQVLVVGGLGVSEGEIRAIASVELFNPTTQQWATLKTGLTDARGGHTATLLPNGQVLVVGGGRVNGESVVILRSAELIDLSLL